MYLVTPGATLLSSIMQWDEMALHRLSWLTPNYTSSFQYCVYVTGVKSPRKTQSERDLLILTAFNCTKVKPIQLAVRNCELKYTSLQR